MPDFLTPEQRSERMSRIRGKDTQPELVVRRFLHAAGFRFRIHAKDLPGKPDIILPKYGVAIFVNGCFWHAHVCQRERLMSSRSAFWLDKFTRNQRRDARSQRMLRMAGWRVFTVWECSLSTREKAERRLQRLAKNIASGP